MPKYEPVPGEISRDWGGYKGGHGLAMDLSKHLMQVLALLDQPGLGVGTLLVLYFL